MIVSSSLKLSLVGGHRGNEDPHVHWRLHAECKDKQMQVPP